MWLSNLSPSLVSCCDILNTRPPAAPTLGSSSYTLARVACSLFGAYNSSVFTFDEFAFRSSPHLWVFYQALEAMGYHTSLSTASFSWCFAYSVWLLWFSFGLTGVAECYDMRAFLTRSFHLGCCGYRPICCSNQIAHLSHDGAFQNHWGAWLLGGCLGQDELFFEKQQ